jgi:hypothetical protein
MGAEEIVNGARAPANTPAGSAVKPVPATNYQLMLAHIVGGQYRSPTLGQQDALGSPPAQMGAPYTPYLLASPAGKPACILCPSGRLVTMRKERVGFQFRIRYHLVLVQACEPA